MEGTTLDADTIDQLKKGQTKSDPNSSFFEGTRMELVGDYQPPCKKLIIEDDDKIMYIDAVGDNTHLRTLKFVLASGKEGTYGSFNEWEETHHPTRRYDFSDKADLLGAFGRVATDWQDETSSHIVTLGFIINNCPGR